MVSRRTVDEPTIRRREDEVYRDELLAHAECVRSVFAEVGDRPIAEAGRADDGEGIT